jgi:membrane protein
MWPALRRIWAPLERTRSGRFAQDTVLAARAIIRGFRGEKITLRAAALTYISIFALVPLFTVALALVEALEQAELREALEGFIRQVLAPGIREKSSAYLNQLLNAASARTAGGVSFVLLMISAGTLLRNLDSSLNEIWNVGKKRRWPVRVLTYVLVLLLGPPFVAISLAGTSLLSRLLAAAHVPFLTQVYEAGWWIASVAGFTALYAVAPAARVRFRPAFAGGLVAGGAWELARRIYAAYVASAIERNPLYGALGVLPFFLIWVYVSWVLVLFGARLAYAVQHAQFRGGIVELGAHPRARELVAARIAQLATQARTGTEEPQDVHALSSRLHVPEATVVEIVDLMTRAGLISLDAKGGILPARSPDELTLADVSSAVGGVSARLSRGLPAKTSEFQEVEPYFAQGDDAVLRRLSRVSWSSLAPPLAAPTARARVASEGRPKS